MFYLGDCVSIVTKTRENERVNESKLDKEVLDEKKERENMFFVI